MANLDARTRQQLELELEGAAMDGLDGGPATPSAAAAAERNMRSVLDRWLREQRLPGISGYTLRVTGGKGLEIDLQWQEFPQVQDVGVDVGKKG